MAEFCDCLLHPFQNDPGVSQQQRVMDELLSGNAKIDARKTADLLDYFYRLSRHVNYYDSQLNVSDWQPFFEKSIPFTLASLIRYDAASIEENFRFYNALFERNPSAAGLRLTILFIFYNTINRINSWHLKVKGSELPIERALGNIIKDKLQQPLKDFIWLNNLASKWYQVDRVDFSRLIDNDIWPVTTDDLTKSVDADLNIFGRRKRLINLQNQFLDLFSSFFEAIKILTLSAEQSMAQSLFPLKVELQKLHTPHLALLFAFLKLFERLQADLNTYTRKHLDFFYKEILKLKPKGGVPDKAHIVFEIQKELDKYLLEKGLLLKDGKDGNKADVLFSLDEEIVVNKAQVADIRTLYLNNQEVHETAYLEGVYIASNAAKADGIDKDFDQGQSRNFATLGSKESKFIMPGLHAFKPYANARLGFILASPVLLLQEGTRTVTITLQCKLDEAICDELKKLNYPLAKKCCQETSALSEDEEVAYPVFFDAKNIYDDVAAGLNKEYYYVSEELIAAAAKKGLDPNATDVLKGFLTSTNEELDAAEPKPYCYCPTETIKFDTTVDVDIFETTLKKTVLKGNTPDAVEVISEFFKKRKPLKLSFSGEKEWIETNKENPVKYEITAGTTFAEFTFTITAVLTPDRDPVTFYNKVNLKEDFDATWPLVKIELDDHYKIFSDYVKKNNGCCLDQELKFEKNKIPVSLYHFFRNVKLAEDARIDVQVCGLKNFVVQNDETVQDVNGPIYAFGTRPKVDSNFYIGAEEIFFKKWNDIWINVNWKNLPKKGFNDYYKGYFQKPVVPAGIELLEGDPQLIKNGFLINVSSLKDGNWYNKDGDAICLFDEATYDLLFPGTVDPSLCFDNKSENFNLVFTHQYHFEQKDFNFPKDRPGEKVTYVGFKKLDTSIRTGFIRFTLKCLDFQHDRYPFVLAEYLIDLAQFKLNNGNVGEGGGPPVQPNQPWDPIIGAMLLDYTATAKAEDIDLIHLYPFEETSKHEEIQLGPSLFPTFCDEGTLFIGLKDVVPGNNLNILFQLAEATGDSESEKEEVHWFYLDKNMWKQLRTGFEVLNDATRNLTTSGVIKFALPGNMTDGNTIMQKDLYWIKATIPENSRSVSETIGIYTQAVQATFTNDAANDKLRLNKPLEAESISKLNTADASVKTVSQPYETFDGRVPEEEGLFYVRVSELLRHKNRGIQKFDYERIVLNAFPQLFKAKCINHSFALNAHLYKNDFPYAPGYVLLAVIPDLNKLKAGNSYEPKVPVSIIEKIEEYMRKQTSAFVRFRAMNPRYEKIHFCLKVKLMLGKDENYYKEKLKDDIRKFIAPWAVGEFYKLTFGQCVNRSDIVQFLETRDYMDFILELNMRHETTEKFPAREEDIPVHICPKTPRSILIAGDIDVCIEPQGCEDWDKNKKCIQEKILINDYCNPPVNQEL
jgi:hypothetical protein